MNVSFFGYLVKNPEVRTTNSGAQITRFRVRTNLVRKDEQGHRKTAFIDVACFGKQGELITSNFVNKSRIFVSGEIDDIQSNTGNNGQIYTNISMNLQSFEFVDSKEEQAALFAAEGRATGGQPVAPGMPVGMPGAPAMPAMPGVAQPGVPVAPGMPAMAQPGVPGVPQPTAQPAPAMPSMPAGIPGAPAMPVAPAMQAPAAQPVAPAPQPAMAAPAGVPAMPAMPAGLSASAFAGL